MKSLILIFILILGFTSCSKADIELQQKFEFVSEYSAIVTVGGFVGITERTFKVGEVYKGTILDSETAKIRIEEPSILNEDCPESWCYQEFLEVPLQYLKAL